MWSDYIEKNSENGNLEEAHWTPHLTIVPEKQAKYEGGEKAVIRYLRENTSEVTDQIDEKKLKPAKMYFTVTKDGVVTDFNLLRTSGYPELDEKIKELINALPGKWTPAENATGEKVNQELVLSFGNMGC